MMTRVLRAMSGAVAFGFLALSQAQAAGPMPIAMTADHWQTKENAEFLRQLGFYHGLMRLNSGDAVLKDITFSDGTIEFDVNTIGRGAPGIAFRRKTKRISSCYISGLIRRVQHSGHAFNMRRRRMACCYGTSFHNIKRVR